MTPRRDVTAERRAQILAAALRVFAQKGYHQARMDDIAQVAGVSKGTLYWYFDSKEALLRTLIAQMFEPDLQVLDRLLAEEDRPVPERLAEMARQAVASLPEAQITLPLLYEFYALASRPGPIQQTIRNYYQGYYERLRALLLQGVQRGELRLEDPDLATLSLMALFEGLLLMWILLPEKANLEAHWERLTHQWLAQWSTP